MLNTTPVDLIGHLTAKITWQTVTISALSLSVAILVSTGAWLSLRGVPIHYIPPGGPGISQPGIIPDTLATDYAARWLMSRYTFTPSTITQAHTMLAATLHPVHTVDFKAKADREATLVKTEKLSSQVVIVATAVVRRQEPTIVVAVDAIRNLFVGGMFVREEPLRAQLTIVPWVAAGQPSGLSVLGVTITPPLSAFGE